MTKCSGQMHSLLYCQIISLDVAIHLGNVHFSILINKCYFTITQPLITSYFTDERNTYFIVYILFQMMYQIVESVYDKMWCCVDLLLFVCVLLSFSYIHYVGDRFVN